MKRLYHRVLKHPWLRWRYGIDDPKLAEELWFWDRYYRRRRRSFDGAGYGALLLEIAGAPDPSFLDDRIVADFGCGPVGSLVWATGARRRIGIDVLADEYARLFATAAQNMEYVRSSEAEIPLADASVDVLFCVNALDHAARSEVMAAEMLRILRPDGVLVGSFNLNLAPTVCEPSPLTLAFLDEHLLRHLEVERRRVAPRGPDSDVYLHVREDGGSDNAVGLGYLWLRGRKLDRRD